MFCADFHVHSNFSDGRLRIPELVDFYGSRGFGAIAITDHLCESTTLLGKAARYLEQTLSERTVRIYLRILEAEAARAWQRYRMVVLPGFELTKNSLSNHRSAHVLALGVRAYIPADGDAKELTRAIRAQGALAVAAHPVHTRKLEKQTYHLWDRREELRADFDAWEVASGPHVFPQVLASGLPMLANSDLHRPEQISSWKTVLDCRREPEAILAAIREQRVRYVFYREGDDDDRCDTAVFLDRSLGSHDLWHHLERGTPAPQLDHGGQRALVALATGHHPQATVRTGRRSRGESAQLLPSRLRTLRDHLLGGKRGRSGAPGRAALDRGAP